MSLKVHFKDKKQISKNESCFYCGSTNTITFSYNKGLVFMIECSNCYETSIY